MDAERHKAYLVAVEHINKVAPAKLHDHEESVLRNAAEGLLLCADIEGDQAVQLRASAQKQLFTLVESGRWTQARADQLLEDIEACCPVPSAALSKTAE